MNTTYRVHVSTDLGGDPDDIQSLFRLVHYSDVLKVEGITSCTGPGSKNRAGLIKEWIERIDVDHLRRRGYEELMTEADLLGRVHQGPSAPGAPAAGKNTPGSDWIIKCAKGGDPEGRARPLWVLVWGSITEVAQAVFDAPEIAAEIRINYIGSSNTQNDPASRDWLYNFMVEECSQLWWIEDGVMPKLSRDTFRGCYQGGLQEGEWGNIAFVEEHIRRHGSTHDGLFDALCGDVFPLATWPQGSLKEGDSPTLLYLLSPVFGGVGNVDDPTQESWGGQFYRPEPGKFANYFTDLDEDAEICQATIAKWRVHYLADWKGRWDRYQE